jgi:hypothetical protein
MGAFYLVAGPDAPGTADATVVVQPVSLMGQVYRGHVRAAIFKACMVNAEFRASRPEFTAAVGNTNGTDVITLGKQHFQDHFPVFLEAFRMGLDNHPVLGLRRARRHEPSGAFNLNQAKPAGTDGSQTVQMAERGKIDTVLTARLQKSGAGRCAYLYAIYRQSNH